MMNKYLEDKQRDMDMRRRHMDMRSRGMRDRAMGSPMDYGYHEPTNDYYGRSGQDNHYHHPVHNQGMISYENTRTPYDYMQHPYDQRTRMGDYRDYGNYNDYNDYYRGDYRRDYSSNEMEEKYNKDLEMWIEKLKKKDRIGMKEQQVIEHAKNMGVKFDKFDEKEFYAVYLMLVSDYKSLGVEPRTYIKMAKEWLEDDDIARKHSEKVCAYLDKIVLGE